LDQVRGLVVAFRYQLAKCPSSLSREPQRTQLIEANASLDGSRPHGTTVPITGIVGAVRRGDGETPEAYEFHDRLPLRLPSGKPVSPRFDAPVAQTRFESGIGCI
jgi:hypothetical protein